jgi:hypothetical protein
MRAFVSERRGDDPKIVGRIAIITRPSKEPTHLVYSPAESAIWVVTMAPNWNEPQRFRTLRAALNSIHPVLEAPEGIQVTETTGTLVS